MSLDELKKEIYKLIEQVEDEAVIQYLLEFIRLLVNTSETA